MNAASLKSPRLRRVLALLSDRQSYSTFEIITGACVAAVNSIIAELRARGAEIDCQVVIESGARRWYYTLVKAPAHA